MLLDIGFMKGRFACSGYWFARLKIELKWSYNYFLPWLG